MSILAVIKSDIEILKLTVDSLGPDATMQKNGVWLTGLELEVALHKARNGLTVQIKELETIIESGIIPEKYKSYVDHDVYYPSYSEKLKKLEPLPPPKHSYFPAKKSRKAAPVEQSVYGLYQEEVTKPGNKFTLEHRADKKYPSGYYAHRVKKAYVEGSDQPKYAVKIFKKNAFHGDNDHQMRVAMRAAYCYKQLGREGLTYKFHGKQFVVTDWLNGVDLAEADQNDVQKMPIPQRIMMALTVLRELNVLHKQGLIHNDIKPANLMINFGKLNLVDLDSVHPKNEVPLSGDVHIYTTEFLDMQTSFNVSQLPQASHLVFNEQTDLSALGLTFAHLFQEIYTPKIEEDEIKVKCPPPDTFKFKTVNLYNGPKYDEHKELGKLIKKMVFRVGYNPETAEKFIEDFLAVLKTYPNHEKYLEEDRLFAERINEATKRNGVKAFQEMECEILGYDQRFRNFHSNFLKAGKF